MITLPDNLRPQEGHGGGDSPPEPLLLMAAAEMNSEGRLSDADRGLSSPAMGAIERAAERHGMDPAVLKGIAGIESSMNPGSNRNASTQYKGLFQIGREEWAQYGRGGDIFNADQNADAAARMLKDHSAWFERQYGRSPAAGELYMMHQQGRGFYSQGTMTNIAGNPYPGMRGPQTPASFEAGWTARLGREIARYGGPERPMTMAATGGGVSDKQGLQEFQQDFEMKRFRERVIDRYRAQDPKRFPYRDTAPLGPENEDIPSKFGPPGVVEPDRITGPGLSNEILDKIAAAVRNPKRRRALIQHLDEDNA